MTTLTDLLFHLDEWLHQLTAMYPLGAYGVFFAIVFSESAFFPLAPFLPGDGLLFAVGVLASAGAVNVWIAIIVLIIGGILGNMVASQLGAWLGPTIFDRIRWLNRSHYQKAHEFYRRHGNKAFFFSRFVPVVRALVPFVAGIAKMDKKQFTKYNILSVAAWVLLIVLVAHQMGHIPFIKNHFTWVIFGLAGLSIVPAIWLGLKKWIGRAA